jgi:hypothetical protein
MTNVLGGPSVHPIALWVVVVKQSAVKLLPPPPMLLLLKQSMTSDASRRHCQSIDVGQDQRRVD